MNILRLLKKLKKNDIEFILKNGGLSIDAPKGSVTPELLQEIKNNKAELISFLSTDIKQIQNIPKVKKTY